jgi:phasin family protein
MAKNPFLDFDMQNMQKMMSDMKLPAFDWEAIMAANRKNAEAFAQANQLAADGVQAILRRQAEILKGSMEEANRSLKSMMSDGTPEDRLVRQAEAMKSAFEQAIANFKELSEMAAKSNAEAFNVVNKRVSESLDELKGVLSKTARKG